METNYSLRIINVITILITRSLNLICAQFVVLVLTFGQGYAGDFKNLWPLTTYYADVDSDGYGDASNSINATSAPFGYVENSDDCNDADDAINPGRTEICDGVDNNCNGIVDDSDQTIFYVDFDGDGFANPLIFIIAYVCTAPPGWSSPYPGTDCDDRDANITGDCTYSELCNGIDDDGDQLIDDNDPDLDAFKIPWFADADQDGYVDPESAVIAACSPPEGYIPSPVQLDLLPAWLNEFGDCDDSNPFIHPGVNDLCNGIDDNCDGIQDHENCNSLDSDCDGVPDTFDVCPGADDTVDNNADGIADCSQLLNYNSYNPDWYCGNNKIYVCHNDNNPQTICIDGSALATHYNHGDKIGPCISCPPNQIMIGNPGEFTATTAILEFFPSKAVNKKYVVNNDEEILFSVLPNPADQHIEVQTNLTAGIISIMDVSGKVIIQQVVYDQLTSFKTSSLMDGIYFVRMQNGAYCHIKSVVVIH